MSLLDQEVRRSWDRIGAWLRSHSPQEERRLRLAADKACVDAVEREMGKTLPADLVALWRLEGVDAGYWLPPAGACALEAPMEGLGTRAILLQVAEEEDPDDPMWPDRFTSELLSGGDILAFRSSTAGTSSKDGRFWLSGRHHPRRRGRVSQRWVADATMTTRGLIRRAWTPHRWNRRP